MYRLIPKVHMISGCILLFTGLIYGPVAFKIGVDSYSGSMYTYIFLSTNIGNILARVGIIIILIGIMKNWQSKFINRPIKVKNQ